MGVQLHVGALPVEGGALQDDGVAVEAHAAAEVGGRQGVVVGDGIDDQVQLGAETGLEAAEGFFHRLAVVGRAGVRSLLLIPFALHLRPRRIGVEGDGELVGDRRGVVQVAAVGEDGAEVGPAQARRGQVDAGAHAVGRPVEQQGGDVVQVAVEAEAEAGAERLGGQVEADILAPFAQVELLQGHGDAGAGVAHVGTPDHEGTVGLADHLVAVAQVLVVHVGIEHEAAAAEEKVGRRQLAVDRRPVAGNVDRRGQPHRRAHAPDHPAGGGQLHLVVDRPGRADRNPQVLTSARLATFLFGKPVDEGARQMDVVKAVLLELDRLAGGGEVQADLGVLLVPGPLEDRYAGRDGAADVEVFEPLPRLRRQDGHDAVVVGGLGLGEERQALVRAAIQAHAQGVLVGDAVQGNVEDGRVQHPGIVLLPQR